MFKFNAKIFDYLSQGIRKTNEKMGFSHCILWVFGCSRMA